MLPIPLHKHHVNLVPLTEMLHFYVKLAQTKITVSRTLVRFLLPSRAATGLSPSQFELSNTELVFFSRNLRWNVDVFSLTGQIIASHSYFRGENPTSAANEAKGDSIGEAKSTSMRSPLKGKALGNKALGEEKQGELELRKELGVIIYNFDKKEQVRSAASR